MAVDTSIYQPQPQANPLQSMTQIIDLKRGMVGMQGQQLQNQLLQRTIAANAAQSGAYAHNIGPDGRVDTAGAMREMSGNPAAQFNLPEAAQQAAVLQQQQTMTALTHLEAIYTTAGALADDPHVTPDKVKGGITQLVAAGAIPVSDAATELAGMPTDPDQLRPWLRAHQMKAQSAGQQIAAYHQQSFINTGAQDVPVNTAPLAEQGAVANTLSPESAASPVAGPVNPDGSPTTIPLGQRAGMGRVTTGIGPAAQAAAGTSGQGNAQQGLSLQTQAQEMPAIKSILGNMQGDLKYFQTGPGAAEWKSLLAGAGRLGINVNPNAVASQENFNKFAAMLAQRQFGILGGTGSDKQLISSIESNPNQQISTEGNRRIINILKGNADALSLANRVWQNWQQQGHGGETFGRFMQKFNENFDPRIMQMQYMNKAERQRMLDGMTGQEKSKFEQQYNKAAQRGWLSQ